MKTGLVFLFLFIASWNGLAANAPFSIQVAATKIPNLIYFRETTGFDSLYTEETKSGLIRIKLGLYHSREDAKKDLRIIKKRGFSDAFITDYSRNRRVVSPTPPSDQYTVNKVEEDNRLPPHSSPAWSTLTEEQKRNVVYVDGVLHLHEGGEFIPLSR